MTPVPNTNTVKDCVNRQAPMIASSASDELYPRIMGGAWWELAPPIRTAHAVGVETPGQFRVTHGTSWLARWLIRASSLPREAQNARVVLQIVGDGSRQRWNRRFDSDAFTTLQWMESADRFLIERFQHWELCFVLRVQEGALLYAQAGARLCIGPLRLPVPLACAPRVQAREEADDRDRVHVCVTVTLPLCGVLIAYDGYLAVEEGMEP